MSEEKKKVTPIVALRNFFGMKEGQTLSEFSAEIKALSEDEKMSLAKAAADALGCELVATAPKA